MSTTARSIIELALKEVGILGVGQTPLPEDINDGFTLLKRMVSQWQMRRWIVPSLMDIKAIGNNAISNPIGNGQFWNTNRPDKIQAGYVIQLNSGGNQVSLPLVPIFSYEDYARIAVKILNSLPTHYFYDGQWPNGNVFIWPIPSNQYEIHLLLKSQLNWASTVATGAITTGGAGYVTANYPAVPLTGGSGISASADFVVTGGVVAIVTLANGGVGYKVGDILSASAASLGGSGAGFSWTVNTLTNTLDTPIELPDEYHEAMHYNLAVRLISMYQVPNPSPQTGVLAKLALKTVKTSNIQIPEMIMPPGLRNGKAFSLYNPDGY